MLIYDSKKVIIKLSGDIRMKKPKKSEKLMLDDVFYLSKSLQREQRGLEIGEIITLIRSQLRMSQRSLAKRAGVPQATISRIETHNFEPNVSTLKKILDAMECDLLITCVPRRDTETIRKKQAQVKAEKKIDYLQGTMSLEKQAIKSRLMSELVNDEVKYLLDAPGSELWDDS